MNMMGGKIATLVLVSTLCSAFASHEADELHGRRIAFSNSLVWLVKHVSLACCTCCLCRVHQSQNQNPCQYESGRGDMMLRTIVHYCVSTHCEVKCSEG